MRLHHSLTPTKERSMKRLFSAKSIVVAAVALGAVGLASAAHARSDVIVSVDLNSAYGYTRPVPVYVQPQPVYVQPQAAYYGQNDRWERNAAYGDWDHDGIPNRFDRHPHRYDARHGYRQAGWGDADRDGVPNRYDREPYNPYRN
jgi:hypothetical protein